MKPALIAGPVFCLSVSSGLGAQHVSTIGWQDNRGKRTPLEFLRKAAEWDFLIVTCVKIEVG